MLTSEQELIDLIRKKRSDIIGEMLDREMVQSRGDGLRAILMSPFSMKEYMRNHSPNVYALHSAGWASGYTVNGVAA